MPHILTLLLSFAALPALPILLAFLLAFLFTAWTARRLEPPPHMQNHVPPVFDGLAGGVPLVRIDPHSLRCVLRSWPDATGMRAVIPCSHAAGQHENSRCRLARAIFPELICCYRTHLIRGERS